MPWIITRSRELMQKPPAVLVRSDELGHHNQVRWMGKGRNWKDLVHKFETEKNARDFAGTVMAGLLARGQLKFEEIEHVEDAAADADAEGGATRGSEDNQGEGEEVSDPSG